MIMERYGIRDTKIIDMYVWDWSKLIENGYGMLCMGVCIEMNMYYRYVWTHEHVWW